MLSENFDHVMLPGKSWIANGTRAEYLLTDIARSFRNVQTFLGWAEAVEGEAIPCVEEEVVVVVVEDSEAVAVSEAATAVVTVAHEAVHEVAFEVVEVEAMLPTEEERYSSPTSSSQQARDSSQCFK
ncbi:hypothetical protein LTR47_008407 [Exophiala xenobiotica]|nr:hypothetical protein LTR41_010595 [Exophiala xenobiotica]KAK5218013.1 hypothetical protein LTR72_009184 [Exophiala xenobiotica]KAK5227836.1 hypothetical protein LTR47_008407 [Exophiala xenobiotica]KAK5253441.1 hypothetical protein LTS06_002152 [Exophiala xenobiotica]KAK5261160.1 hypothetical protein LTR40_002760 [Exophiala xenobiotica]